MPTALQVLLIDDNPDDRALVVRALGREFPDISATEIKDLEGLERAMADFHYDVIITDYQLNWSTGLDLLPLLKSRQPECPVIMFTATGNEEIAVRSLKAGLNDYVLKSPRHFVQLAAAVRNILDGERNRQRAELSEARLHDLMTRLNVGLYRLAPEGRLTYANPAFLRIFGMTTAQEAQDWDLAAHAVHPEEAALLKEALLKAGRVRNREMRIRGSGGEEIWISLTLSALKTPAKTGEAGHAIEGMVEDITEVKRLDLALRAKEEELRQSQKLESIGRLAGGIAHDFNNLLTAINGYSDLLLEMLGEEHPHRDSLVEIRKAGTRAATLTRELLAFSRRQMLQPKAMDLNDVVFSLDGFIRRILGDNIKFETRLAPGLSRFRADPGQMEVILKNLVLNARDAMPKGGRLILETEDKEIDGKHMSASSRPDGDLPSEPDRPGTYVCLSVEDNGTGMDAETLARIFEPFYTTKPMGKGSGMGLATVYGIVKQSGGQISVSSEPDAGTRFRIFFPALRSGDQVSQAQGGAREPGRN